MSWLSSQHAIASSPLPPPPPLLLHRPQYALNVDNPSAIYIDIRVRTYSSTVARVTNTCGLSANDYGFVPAGTAGDCGTGGSASV